MSRTLAHRPYDVRRLDNDTPTVEHHDHRNGICRLETIEDYKQRTAIPGTKNFGVAANLWRWQIPCSPELLRKSHWYEALPPMPHDARRLVWEKPARQKARQQLRRVVQESNSGDIETEVEPYYTRNQARWHWS